MSYYTRKLVACANTRQEINTIKRSMEREGISNIEIEYHYNFPEEFRLYIVNKPNNRTKNNRTENNITKNNKTEKSDPMLYGFCCLTTRKT